MARKRLSCVLACGHCRYVCDGAAQGHRSGGGVLPGRSYSLAIRRAGCLLRPAHPGATLVKGEFKLGNGRYCNPLTITDMPRGFLLLCEALESTREDLACTAFEVLIQSPVEGCSRPCLQAGAVKLPGLFEVPRHSGVRSLLASCKPRRTPSASKSLV
jgi:hypothetical protein